MDPATLRIKFTPLIKYFSKCSLEIVPELSAIQNLKKIKWNNENDFIEYIVPMTYKIVLKKNHLHDANVPRDNLNKTYHSCVDLLLSSPVTNMNLESGDVQRVISDTYILRQMTEAVTNIIVETKSVKNNVITTSQNASNNYITNENDYQCIAYNNFNSCLQSLALYSKVTEGEIDISEDLHGENIFVNNSILFNSNSLETAVNTISDINSYTETLAQSVETVNKSTIARQAPSYPTYRLTVTPVCIIDTREKTATIRKSITTESFIKESNATKKNLISIKTYKNDKNISFEDNFPHQILSSTVRYERDLKRIREFDLNNRILPEIRITEFIKFMEKEIMPLKLMLHEILHKCSTLGITFRKLSCSDQEGKYQRQQASNRFVYTIVFDE